VPKRYPVKRPSLLLAAFAAALALAGPASAGNPFGIRLVRFEPGTTPAQMRAAVTTAGGIVVGDLSPIDALAAASRAPRFAARLRDDRRVAGSFEDEVLGKEVAAADSPPPPDPWHDLSSFFGVTNPEGILQWDDNRMHVPAAWATTTGDPSVAVAVLDTGVERGHRELRESVDPSLGGNFIPCDLLVRQFGVQTVNAYGLRDCSAGDKEGHGTWVASRIAGAVNGFASNGVAPGVRVGSYQVLAAGFGGLSSWILAGLVDACTAHHADVVNMSIVGYLDPSDPFDVQVYLLLARAVSYCRSQGVAVFASAGNEHVRIDRVDLTLAGQELDGAGLVTLGPEGFATASPGSSSLDRYDLRGMLEVPGGLPGVEMVSATANAIGAAPPEVPLGWHDHVGARDQLAYYSNYGPRVDLAAPGGARRYQIPGYDGGAGDILYGGWGSLGALSRNGLLCTDPFAASAFNAACFVSDGQPFGWLQGTSMSSPNAAAVAALVLSARPALRGHPDALEGRVENTANTGITNFMGPNDPLDTDSSLDGRPCATGYCHISRSSPISFADAYGAGLVDAAAAVG
jgi:lantibiotic leader peptide-processing serine protease